MARNKSHKPGRLSAEELASIHLHAGTKSAGEIARLLNRHIHTIQKELDRIEEACPPVLSDTQMMAVSAELKNSRRWQQLKKELTAEELHFFEEEYVKLTAQFRGDVLASEMGQVFDAIKIDVLKSRILVKEKAIAADAERFEAEKAGLLERVAELDGDERDRLNELDRLIASLRQADARNKTDYVNLQEERSKQLKALKANRDQRIQEIQESKQSFLGLIKQLQDEEIRSAEGRESGLAALARDREHGRLGSLHTYENGEVDRPILSADTLDIDGAPGADAAG